VRVRRVWCAIMPQVGLGPGANAIASVSMIKLSEYLHFRRMIRPLSAHLSISGAHHRTTAVG